MASADATPPDPKLQLITRLLAKAESTTPAEAEALTEHAERLMLKYGIDQAMLAAHDGGGPSERIVDGKLEFRGSYALDQFDLGVAIVGAIGELRPIKAPVAGGVVLYVVGFESDVARAITLIHSLRLQSEVALRAWWRDARLDYGAAATPGEKRSARAGFIRGFGYGAAERIRASKAAIVRESGEGSGAAVALLDRQQQVDAEITARGLPMARRRRRPDAHGFRGGHRAGLEARVGGGSIDRGRGIARWSG